MKDIVGNRQKLDLARKVRLLGLAARENGIAWTFYFGLYYGGSFFVDRAFQAMDRLRRKHRLPGLNSVEMNRETWQAWDWAGGGEEWTLSAEWKRSLIDNVLLRHMPAGGHIVEIGPGAGRWTEALQRVAGQLTGVDLSATCVEICRTKFAHCANTRFLVNNGNDLPGIEDGSIDGIWSFDGFVHINRPEVEKYVREFRRVLKPGGRAAIHHGKVGGAKGGWRSDLTVEDFNAMLASAGLRIIDQIGTWQDQGTEYHAGLYDDLITVFER